MIQIVDIKNVEMGGYETQLVGAAGQLYCWMYQRSEDNPFNVLVSGE